MIRTRRNRNNKRGSESALVKCPRGQWTRTQRELLAGTPHHSHISRQQKPQRDAATAAGYDGAHEFHPSSQAANAVPKYSKQTGSFDWAKRVENPPRQEIPERRRIVASCSGIRSRYHPSHPKPKQNPSIFIFFVAFPIPKGN